MKSKTALVFLFAGLLLGAQLIGAKAFAAWPLADGDGKPLPSLAPMLKDVNPAVVNIATFTEERAGQSLIK